VAIASTYFLNYCYIITDRIAAKWQTAGIKCTRWLKISIFALQGRLIEPIHLKFGTAEGHIGPLGRVKIHANR